MSRRTAGRVPEPDLDRRRPGQRPCSGIWPAALARDMIAAGIRNRGNREFSVARAQELCELQVDGRWYRWAGDVDLRR